jgi:hypothetical protein
MFSSQDLIVNGGFANASSQGIAHWEVVSPDRSSMSWRRVAVADFSASGIPRSAYAIELASHGETGGGHLLQEISLPPGSSRHFALRLAARASTGRSECEIVVAATGPAPRGQEEVVARSRFRASSDWARHRVAFAVAERHRNCRLQIRIYGSDRPGRCVWVTDVRLISLIRPSAGIAIRFDTLGDLSMASSRLRAWRLEDYLDLLGWPTSVNGGRSFAVRVCQKVRPWSTRTRATRGDRLVIYDLDDNNLLLSAREARRIQRFVSAADAVTTGSEFLRQMLAQWNDRTFLLENPVDVLDRDIVHRHDEWQGRVAWFGNPENLWMLERLACDRPIATITRGGDVEYRTKTIDEHLVTFDLAVLPVLLNDETRAKNANRLVKCVGLGLPFLASDTPEHRRALTRLQLPDVLLVASQGEWAGRIEDVARRYRHYKQLIETARPRAFDIYGVERIAWDWVAFWSQLPEANRLRTRG